MHADGSALLQRVGFGTVNKGDASPLKVYGPGFLIADIGQSTPYPGAMNTITVTIASSVDLSHKEAAVVTVSEFLRHS